MKPLVGLTPTPETLVQEHGTFRLHTLNENYSRSVIAAGGIPVMLPSNTPDVGALLDRLDGVILTGGGDIDPAEYGEEKHEKTDGIDAERDAFEQALLKEAFARNLPVLGICRGLQIFNVTLGGTLIQDLDELLENSQEHRQQSLKMRHDELFQDVELAEGNHPLRHATYADHLDVNSFHHQGIDSLAPQLRIMARTADGLIEGVYNPEVTFGVAVQWHPELLQHQHSEHAALFKALIDAASEYRLRNAKREVAETV